MNNYHQILELILIHYQYYDIFLYIEELIYFYQYLLVLIEEEHRLIIENKENVHEIDLVDKYLLKMIH